MSFYKNKPRYYFIDILDTLDGHCLNTVNNIDAAKFAHKEFSHFLLSHPYTNIKMARDCSLMLQDGFVSFNPISWNTGITYVDYKDSNNYIGLKIKNGVLDFRMNLKKGSLFRSIVIQKVYSHE